MTLNLLFDSLPFDIQIKAGNFPTQEIHCEKLKTGSVKLWMDPALDKAYILFNAGDANKRSDGTHDPKGVTQIVDYFIRYKAMNKYIQSI